MRRKLVAGAIGAVVSTWTPSLLAIQENQIAPPEVRYVDEYGVNLASGQVDVTVKTVSIGGSLGLSHSISAETNHFGHRGGYGYLDKFAGTARYAKLGEMVVVDGQTYRWANVMRVFGPVGSQDFKVMVDGSYVDRAYDIEGNFTYESLGDPRHTLEVEDSGYLVWTTEDGTRLRYKRTKGSNAAAGGDLEEIVYPNGLAVHTYPVSGVTTNAGFQLKYEYESNSLSLSSEKQAILDSLPEGAQVGRPDGWGRNPVRIWGVNNAYRFCSTEANVDCDLEGEWPKASFHWPPGMPTAFYLGESVFSIVDADGGVTGLHYEAQDVSLKDLDDPDSSESVVWGLGERWSPRLVGVKSAGSDVIDRRYTYRNDGSMKSDANTGLAPYVYWELDSVIGKIVKAETPRGVTGYSLGPNDQSGNPRWQSGSGGTFMSVTMRSRWPRKKLLVNIHRTGESYFEANFRNFMTRFSYRDGGTERYEYGDRGNLVKIKHSGGGEEYTTEAGYPDTCGNPKTCNKPLWIKDRRGNVTDYTYHEASGQIRTVTGPADANGIRPQTRYHYDALYAYYKKDSETIERADSPIWLLTREAHCRTTSATGDGCQGGARDEVVTEYYYGPQQAGTPNNLFLRGVSVTAHNGQDMETRTTCYEYDRFGNRIGETRPKGGASAQSCP